MRPHLHLRLVFGPWLVLCLLVYELPKTTETAVLDSTSLIAKHRSLFNSSQPATLKSSHHDSASSMPFTAAASYPSIAKDSGMRCSVDSLRSAAITEWNWEAGHGRSPPRVS